MRTTVTLAPDVASEVARIRRERGVGLSEALNDLARRGMGVAEPASTFVQTTHPMGAKVDVANIGDVLDLLDSR
jgi:hypothetical protein